MRRERVQGKGSGKWPDANGRRPDWDSLRSGPALCATRYFLHRTHIQNSIGTSHIRCMAQYSTAPNTSPEPNLMIIIAGGRACHERPAGALGLVKKRPCIVCHAVVPTPHSDPELSRNMLHPWHRSVGPSSAWLCRAGETLVARRVASRWCPSSSVGVCVGGGVWHDPCL